VRGSISSFFGPVSLERLVAPTEIGAVRACFIFWSPHPLYPGASVA